MPKQEPEILITTAGDRIILPPDSSGNIRNVAPAPCGGRRPAPALNRNSSTGAHRRVRHEPPG